MGPQTGTGLAQSTGDSQSAHIRQLASVRQRIAHLRLKRNGSPDFSAAAGR